VTAAVRWHRRALGKQVISLGLRRETINTISGQNCPLEGYPELNLGGMEPISELFWFMQLDNTADETRSCRAVPTQLDG